MPLEEGTLTARRSVFLGERNARLPRVEASDLAKAILLTRQTAVPA